MKRVIVIGCPGSGKSVFSKRLHSITGIPLTHLDNLYWNADRTIVPREVFLSRLENVMNEDTWIIDGNYGSTMPLRMDKCDTIFFLDYPTEICIAGIMERRGKSRDDLPWTEAPDEIDESFLSYVRDFRAHSRPEILRLLNAHSGKRVVRFTDRDEATRCLEELRESGQNPALAL
ncbi:MAG: adenylate kinase [Clostridia bacterium]|nr:adenylate kinase [Clostridia bacterium]